VILRFFIVFEVENSYLEGECIFGLGLHVLFGGFPLLVGLSGFSGFLRYYSASEASIQLYLSLHSRERDHLAPVAGYSSIITRAQRAGKLITYYTVLMTLLHRRGLLACKGTRRILHSRARRPRRHRIARYRDQTTPPTQNSPLQGPDDPADTE